jgi:hypothetical protein
LLWFRRETRISFPREWVHCRSAKRAISLTIVLFLLPTMLMFFPGRAGASTVKSVLSDSSAGYIVNYANATGQTFDDVLGYWTVPTIVSTHNATAVLEYVGVDLADGTGIQIGTSQFSQNQSTFYRAFYAIYPENFERPVIIKSLAGEVGPGMTVAGEIHRNGNGNWTLFMLTMDRTFSPIDSFQTSSFAHPTSRLAVEWSVGKTTDLPLANFTRIDFLGSNATVNGHDHFLNDMSNIKVNMADRSTGCSLVVSDGITAPVPSFTVSFIRSGPPCEAAAVPNTVTVPQPPLNFEIPFIIGGSLVAGLLLAAAVLTISSEGRKRVLHHNGKQDAVTSSSSTGASSITCLKCGSPLHQGGRFCEKCGTESRTVPG